MCSSGVRTFARFILCDFAQLVGVGVILFQMPFYWVEVIRSTNLTLQMDRIESSVSNEGCRI